MLALFPICAGPAFQCCNLYACTLKKIRSLCMYVLIIWTILKYSGLQVGWFVLHIGHNEDYLFNNIITWLYVLMLCHKIVVFPSLLLWSQTFDIVGTLFFYVRLLYKFPIGRNACKNVLKTNWANGLQLVLTNAINCSCPID